MYDTYLIQKKEIIQKQQKLSFHKQVIFSACCSERIAPMMLAFSLVHKSEHYSIVRSVLSGIWKWVAEPSIVEKKEFEDYFQRVNCIVLNVENDSTMYAMQGLLAIDVVKNCLQHILTEDSKYLVQITEIMLSCVHDYLLTVNYPYLHGQISESDSNNFNRWLAQSPLIFAEIKKQLTDIEYLNIHNNLTQNEILELKTTALSVAIDPISRGLILNEGK